MATLVPLICPMWKGPGTSITPFRRFSCDFNLSFNYAVVRSLLMLCGFAFNYMIHNRLVRLGDSTDILFDDLNIEISSGLRTRISFACVYSLTLLRSTHNL